MISLTQEIRDKIINGKPAERIYICGQSFLGFALYYFNIYFSYLPAPFHREFAEDCESLSNGSVKEAVWIAFREAAKTSFAKIFIIWLICYQKKRYINFDSFDGENAKNALFDITTDLQTNQRLIADFGHLYNEVRTFEQKKMKKIAAFITNEWPWGKKGTPKEDNMYYRPAIKVEAFSVGKSIRGRLFRNIRPDMWIGDDLENEKTILSSPITQKTIAHIDSLRAGLPEGSGALYLGNYLSDQGVVQTVMDKVKNAQGVIRFIPILKNNEIAWPDKYVKTEEEAIKENKNRDKTRKKIALETKKRDLGDTIFNTEMMLSPLSAADLVFNRAKITELLDEKEREYDDKAGFRIWDKYNPSHRYAIGADTSDGIGLDSNSSVLIDFSTMPNKQIGSYASNTIAADVFAHELKREGNMFGECLIAPENNTRSGGTCINELKAIYPIEYIFRQRSQGKDIRVRDKIKDVLGWETNTATKHDMILQLKTAIEDGKLKIYDKRILEEARRYGRKDLSLISIDSLATRHFDLLMACAIAWAMRNYAEAKETEETYQQPDYEPLSEYEEAGSQENNG